MPAECDTAQAGAERRRGSDRKGNRRWEQPLMREQERGGHEDRRGIGGVSAWIRGLGLVPLQSHEWARAAIDELYGMMRHDAAE